MEAAREHGTTATYQWHKRRGEEACPECQQASTEYMRTYRKLHPDVRARGNVQVAAYSAAQARLRERHRKEFNRLYAEELCKLQGLD